MYVCSEATGRRKEDQLVRALTKTLQDLANVAVFALLLTQCSPRGSNEKGGPSQNKQKH